MESPKVCILLAAYNGQKYIRQMIDSVLLQDYRNIQLILSDDGSQDDTRDILAEYAQREPDRVVYYQSGVKFGCPQKHFLHLLSQFHDAPYIMFCDQDDIWYQDKVGKTLSKMQMLEAGADIPAMVHTDLRVVDAQLHVINPSFWNYSKLDGTRLALNQLLVQNVVTGCTMMINRALAECVCNSIPENGILMHDWWIAMLASVCGRTDAISDATMDYRQHGSNDVGAKNVRSIKYLLERLANRSMQVALNDNKTQAEKFLQCYADIMNLEQIAVVRGFIKAQESTWLKRNILYIRYGLMKKGFLRKAVQLLGL